MGRKLCPGQRPKYFFNSKGFYVINEHNRTSDSFAECQAHVCAPGRCPWGVACQSRGEECSLAPSRAREAAHANSETVKALAQVDAAIRMLTASKTVLQRVLGERAA